jgi:hypothetical protein
MKRGADHTVHTNCRSSPPTHLLQFTEYERDVIVSYISETRKKEAIRQFITRLPCDIVLNMCGDKDEDFEMVDPLSSDPQPYVVPRSPPLLPSACSSPSSSSDDTNCPQPCTDSERENAPWEDPPAGQTSAGAPPDAIVMMQNAVTRRLYGRQWRSSTPAADVRVSSLAVHCFEDTVRSRASVAISQLIEWIESLAELVPRLRPRASVHRGFLDTLRFTLRHLGGIRLTMDLGAPRRAAVRTMRGILLPSAMQLSWYHSLLPWRRHGMSYSQLVSQARQNEDDSGLADSIELWQTSFAVPM